MTEYIVRDGDTGRALVSSSNIPVDEILQALQDGGQFDAALRQHPRLTPAGVAAALRFARLAVERGGRPARDPRDDDFVGVREVALHSFNGGGAGTVTLEAEEFEHLISRLDFLEGILGEEEEPERAEGVAYEQMLAGANSDASISGAAGFGRVQQALASAAAKREQLRYELDLIDSIHAGLEDVAAGRVISHEDAVAFLRAKIPG